MKEGGSIERMEYALGRLLIFRSKTLFLFEDDIFKHFERCQELILEAKGDCIQFENSTNFPDPSPEDIKIKNEFPQKRLNHLKMAEAGIEELQKACKPYLKITDIYPV